MWPIFHASNEVTAPVLPPVMAVLENDEFLTLICSQILPWHASSLRKKEFIEGRVQLVKIALVCRAFTEPALRRLWTYLDLVMPLVQLLPGVKLVEGTYVSTFSCILFPQYFHGTIPPESSFASRAIWFEL